MAKRFLVRRGRMTRSVLIWCRQLLPAAVLLVAPFSPPPDPPPDDETIVLDADEIDSPLALAHAIARAAETSSDRS